MKKSGDCNYRNKFRNREKSFKIFKKKGLIVEGCSRKCFRKTKNYFHSNLDISNINDVRDWIKKHLLSKK